ncbi:helix-turn-helix domain-containing protein [Actinoplanes sp. NPDC049596]|uniref:helix-turn-helix domain-containing protein n=1 Tax=unclassified Actinoplanes TaxID=2626549 RepID=UPI00341DDB41
MKDLAVRLAALDPDAGAAVRVIAYFDRLAEERAGLRAIVRGAAVLAGCPARLDDDERHVRVRVEPDGSSASGGPADPIWMSAPVGEGATLSLERPGTPGPIEAMVLERAAAAARAVLDRTRGHAARPDPASAELAVDREALEPLRLRAASRLGFHPTDAVRAVALPGGIPRLIPAASPPNPPARGPAAPSDGVPRVVPAVSPPNSPHGDGARRGDPADVLAAERAGVGPAVLVKDLPESWAAAQVALRFTAEDTDQDPGRRVVHAEQLGGLVLLAPAIGPATEPHPDVRALERAAASAPWMLRTLDAVAEAASLRAAASALRVHHSTLQDRLAHSQPLLGWDPREPQGRLRLQLALALRRLHRNPVS